MASPDRSVISANSLRNPALTRPAADERIIEFHRRMPGYAPTPLFEVPALAEQLGVGRLLVKAESQRMGLPSFKILGASWATYRAICDHLGAEPEGWQTLGDLAQLLKPLGPLTLVAATDGNHGRAVAFMARNLGLECEIYVPAGMSAARIDAIAQEGATVTVVEGTYDEAVAISAQRASDRCLVISDTSWPGYETTPGRVIDGYSTIFGEIDQAIEHSAISRPTVVVAPIGVGAFMAAAVDHYRAMADPASVSIVGVEPLDANCVQVSAQHGEISHVPGPHRSVMVGLNCGTPSLTAWPTVSQGVDWFVSIDDESALAAMRSLAEQGIVAGETGAAALAGLTAFQRSDDWPSLAIDPASATVLVMVTEGASDPGAYQQIVGRPPDAVGRIVTVR